MVNSQHFVSSRVNFLYQSDHNHYMLYNSVVDLLIKEGELKTDLF